MARPRRDIRQPRYLDDFMVTRPRRQLPSNTLYDHSTEGATAQLPAPLLTPERSAHPNVSSEDVLSALREIKEDNNQLRQEMQNLLSNLSLRTPLQPPCPTERHPVEVDGTVASPLPHYPSQRTSTPGPFFSQRASESEYLPWPEAVPIPPYDEPLPPPPPPVSYPCPEESRFINTPQYVEPYTLPSEVPSPSIETVYRGPKPHIPYFTEDDPRQFARLKIALDNILPKDATERFKYQILVDHLKLEDALLIADSYSHSPTPFSKTMASLTEMYGQPHKLALQRINEVQAEPPVRSGDSRGFRLFALKVRALVGMLEQLGIDGKTELECGSHTARLLSKLPHDLRAQFKRFIDPIRTPIPTLVHFSKWLEYEVRVQDDDSQPSHFRPARDEWQKLRPKQLKSGARPTTVLLGSDPAPKPSASLTSFRPETKMEKPKKYCPYCDSVQHYFNQCTEFKKFNTDQRAAWIKTERRCWRCGRKHRAAQCYLKAKCQQCNQTHLEILHEVNSATTIRSEEPPPETVQPVTYYLDPALRSSCVLLKMVKIILYNGKQRLETYAILDDGSERTIILHKAAQELQLNGQSETLALRTIRQDIKTVSGKSVSFSIASTTCPQKRFRINGAFTAAELGLSKHSHPVEALQKTYRHLRGLPLHSFSQVQPLLLIGSDYPHLLTPVEPVHLGPPGGPAALRTRLGWTLQGPAKVLLHQSFTPQCLLINTSSPSADLLSHVSKLWQMDILPYRNEKLITRSKQDKAAIKLLEEKTIRVDVDNVQRYATPLLWKEGLPPINAPKIAVMSHLRGTESRLTKDSSKAASYNKEIKKLLDAGYIRKLTLPQEQSCNSWYIPHHMVHHNDKDRVVFNCAFTFQGTSLNEHLLPGPTLGATLLGVLLRFREYPIAVSSDIKGMFHQVRLLSEDQPFLRFLWRDMDRSRPPDIYQWQVLPFGTTCSPCCATFALQKHVIEHSNTEEDTRHSIENCFYVDNLLQSFPSMSEAKQLVTKLQDLLQSGGFELRQWATNVPDLISHMPHEQVSENRELWLSMDGTDPPERTLGLHWHCRSDTITYRLRHTEQPQPTMRTIYRILARQYDPLGLLIPYTTRAKILVQRLWGKKRDWDDPHLPEDFLQLWTTWESELYILPNISLPRCYVQPDTDLSTSTQSIHIFSDASEKAYGSVAYLRTVGSNGEIQVAFLAARSRVAPVRQQSIPRLELCAAHVGAQLGSVLKRELTLPVSSITYWTDSTTVLKWLQSPSCRYKVFVGARVADIQELTENSSWRYVHSSYNPADDITRGLTLLQIIGENRWSNGPGFLKQSESSWPLYPDISSLEDLTELRKVQFCGQTTTSSYPPLPDPRQCSTFKELLEASARACHGAASNAIPTAEDFRQAELSLLRQAQRDSFPEEFSLLSTQNPVSSNSRLLTLAPEYDSETQLIRVGGRLRRCESLSKDTLHPIVLDPHHPITKLIIADYDSKLAHPGAERVFAELRRKFWILRGREAVRKHQHHCPECCKWRSKPVIPKMADLPPTSLRLHKPAFYSTGMDCFGPYLIKSGRRNEKRWGIIFKCLTTHAVYLDLLASMDTDSFLMSLRRFIARRGKPHELLSDQGTNFKGGSSELKEAFNLLAPDLQSQLASQQIHFHFNPPNAPHFGGSWEREIRAIKSALHTILGSQTVTEEVLRTILTEVESIINSKPLGYTSTDVADPDPITPNMLLMGRLDSSTPQVIYPQTDLLSRRRWRHCQALADQFWIHFIRDYLPSLQSRSKWQQDCQDLAIGDIVLIVDQQLPRALWLIGTVTAVFPGVDGRVRTVQVQVKDRNYTRPVAKLIRLPSLPQDTPNWL